MALGQILGSAAPSFPTNLPKAGRTAHVFATQGVTHRLLGSNTLSEVVPANQTKESEDRELSGRTPEPGLGEP